LFGLYPAETRYFWNQLTEREKQLFAIIYDGVANYEEVIELPEDYFTVEELVRVRFVVDNDCPELIQYHNMGYSGTSEAWPEYYYDRAEGQRRFGIVKTKTAALNAQAQRKGTEFERELLIYRYIIENMEYDGQYREVQTADGVFVNERGVCASYASAMALSCRMAGIPCFVISGYGYDDDDLLREHSEENAHAWNAVQIGGKWYYADPTWDDPTYEDGGSAPEYAIDFPEYFNVNEAFMSQSHERDQEKYADWNMPVFTATDAEYYKVMMNDYIVVGHWSDELRQQGEKTFTGQNDRIVLIFGSVEERDAAIAEIDTEMRKIMRECGWSGRWTQVTLDTPVFLILLD